MKPYYLHILGGIIMKKKLFVILGILAAMDLTDILAKGQLLGGLDELETDEPVETFKTYAGNMIRGKIVLKVADFWKHLISHM